MIGPVYRSESVRDDIRYLLWCVSVNVFEDIYAYFEIYTLPYGQPMKYVHERCGAIKSISREDKFNGFMTVTCCF